jgi:predicted lactoylglutathione lyase
MTKQIWANLPVKNVEQTRIFFKALDFKPNTAHDNGGDQLASFLIGDDDFIIHFFSEDNFKNAAETDVADVKEGSEILFTLSAASRKEVDEWAKKVKAAGGTVFSKPKEVQDSIYGCGFADLDGHRWNVLYRELK